MKQLRLAFADEETADVPLPVAQEQAQQLVELMAKAIVALLKQPQGEKDEPT